MGLIIRAFQKSTQYPALLSSYFGLGAHFRGLATQPEPQMRSFGVSVGFNRLQDYYYDVVQENIMILNYKYPGENFVLVPPPVKVKEKFHGPIYDETGKVIKKKPKPRRPAPLPITPFTVPELNRIQIQTMMPEAITNKYQLLSAFLVLQSITGEKARTIFSKLDNAQWKLRKGMPVGAKVTLTGGAMYSFLDKLVEVVLPRIKEWDGLKFDTGDGTGNLALGLSPSSVSLFPDIEVIFDAIPNMIGFHIIFGTTAARNNLGCLLMSALQIPFIKK